MSAPLGSFTPRPAQQGDAFQARFAVNRPLIVQVVSIDGARQVKDQQTGQPTVKKAAVVHVWDLVGGQVSVSDQGMPVQGAPNTVYCNVLWMAPAIVDNLESYVGAAPMPLRIVSAPGKSGRAYLSLAPIEGPELQQVEAFFQSDPTRIEREAAAKMQAAATQAAAPAYQQSGFQPMQVQPSNGYGVPAQQFVPNQVGTLNGYGVPAQQAGQNLVNGLANTGQQAPAAAQFQAAPGQPGALAQIPGQVAQQFAPVDQAAQQFIAAPGQIPNGTPQSLGQAMNQPGSQFPQQAPAAPAQPQFQQAPGQPGYVHNSDVQNILAGLAAGQQPTG